MVINKHEKGTKLYELACKASHGLISISEYEKALKDGNKDKKPSSK